MQFQSLENTFPDNSTLNVDYANTKAAWTEVYFSKSSDNNTNGVQEIYRSNKVESGSKQVVAPSPSDYPYIIYKGYDLDATVSISYTFPTIDEKIEETNKEIKLLNKLDTHIPTVQETASVSIMLDYIDAFFPGVTWRTQWVFQLPVALMPLYIKTGLSRTRRNSSH